MSIKRLVLGFSEIHEGIILLHNSLKTRMCLHHPQARRLASEMLYSTYYVHMGSPFFSPPFKTMPVGDGVNECKNVFLHGLASHPGRFQASVSGINL